MAKNNTYHYDAFISYRHNEIDKFVAENLHRLLETYRLPKNIRLKNEITKKGITRVFRDQEELPLSSNLEDPIVTALENSDYLIVICSPRLKESMWCKREIETFIKLHGREKVLSVLVEGEPNESFPEEILYVNEKITDKNGKTKTVKKCVEPLAADVRGKDKKAILKALKKELLRLLAPMFQLNYDDLRQRHHERIMRQRIIVSSSIAIGCFILALYSTVMLLKINQQKNMLKSDQAINLAESALNDLNNDEVINAIDKSYQALTNYKGVKMPYTALAEYSLAESLSPYDSGISSKAIDQLDTEGVVLSMKVSPNREMLLSYDKSNKIILWDLANNKKLFTTDDINSFSINDNSYTFVGNKYFAFISASDKICVVDIKSKKIIKEIEIKSAYTINSDESGLNIVVNDLTNIHIINTDGFKDNKIYTSNEKDDLNQEIYVSDKYVLFNTDRNGYQTAIDNTITLHIYDIAKKELSGTTSLNATYINELDIKDNSAYVLNNLSYDSNYVMKVTRINLNTSDKTWEQSFKGNFGTRLAIGIENNKLVVISSNTAYLISKENGEVLNIISIGDTVSGLLSGKSGELFLAFTRDGENYILDGKTGKATQLAYLYQLNCRDYQEIMATNYGYVAILLNDNRIIRYDKIKNDELKSIDETVELGDKLSSTEIKTIAEDMDLEKKNLVSAMVYNDDKDKLFITYTDSSLDIYDIDKDKVITTIDSVDDSIDYYFGEAKNGYIFIGGTSYGYILNNKYEKIARIEQLRAYDKKNNEIVVVNGKNYFKISVFDTDDLLEMAEAKLK